MLALILATSSVTSRPLTLYHVNPLHEGVIPVNMDTADLHGDMFFDLRSKTVPIECSLGGPTSSSDCSNQEVVDHDLVITKLAVEVYGDFAEYGRCNTCNSSDIDPFSRLPCHGASYLCSCGDFEHPKDCSKQVPVGAQNVTDMFHGFSNYLCTWENWVKRPWMCWGFGVVGKVGTPGTNMWYSMTEAGWCDAEGADKAKCSWSAQPVKVVNKSCSDKTIYSAVEAYDAEHDGHFSACPTKQTGAARNTSDPCWIYSFYATVLGAEALLPGGPVEGMPTALLDAAFERPFEDPAKGGCPAVTPPPQPPPRATTAAAATARGRGHPSFGVFAPTDPKLQAAFQEAAWLAEARAVSRKLSTVEAEAR